MTVKTIIKFLNNLLYFINFHKIGYFIGYFIGLLLIFSMILSMVHICSLVYCILANNINWLYLITKELVFKYGLWVPSLLGFVLIGWYKNE